LLQQLQGMIMKQYDITAQHKLVQRRGLEAVGRVLGDKIS
jgi:hypothetical protein